MALIAASVLECSLARTEASIQTFVTFFEVEASCLVGQQTITVILLDWTGVDLTPKSTPYAEDAVELQDSNMAPDQIYTINSKSWQKIGRRVRKNVPNRPKITKPLYKLCDFLHQSHPQRQHMRPHRGSHSCPHLIY